MRIVNFTILIFCLALYSCGTEMVNFDGMPGDRYNTFEESPFVSVSENPVSTFSVDADGASYANARRFIMLENRIPPTDAIRTEEFINYFDLEYSFDYSSGHPISLNGEVSVCPWNTSNKLIRIGIKGKPIPKVELPASNFVFLIDVSGSMASEDKLELLKNGFNLLVDELSENDKVAIVTYASAEAILLESTPGSEKEKIKAAINKLGAGGSTAGAKGIISAYDIAQKNLIPGGNNRIILGTDGDFNVGVSSQEELVRLIEEKRNLGIFLTVLGVGRGNLNDGSLEQIANNGNGTYEYIDNIEQLKKVFIYDYGKFYTVAKDVKVQVKFNPENIESYRLIGYENRSLTQGDFENDEKDAGEIGANQNITALYEVVPKSSPDPQIPAFIIDFRYKTPDADNSIPLELSIFDKNTPFEESSDFMRFTASVASFSMILRNSAYKGNSGYDNIISWLNTVNLSDAYEFKAQLKDIIQKVKSL